ncbi:MAG: AraC family transcriptional regulator ligand-binding domain-containing protein [Gammaproteobacteria bacterium]|nr:AraC family transcriptional regulator ligand-binding domain-containing protein [Gammaproteobacteria bacterium]NVK88186.1 AraC family transcriptional regulator ligand-binding domain-containing protein [Gammaproteobacteria bacterium]
MNWDLLTLLKQLIVEQKLTISQSELEATFSPAQNISFIEKSIFALIDRIIAGSGHYEVGLSVGKFINPNSFHGLGYLFMTADNLLMACQRISELPALYQHLVTMETSFDDHHLVFRVSNRAPNATTRAVINEATLGIIYQYTNWLSREVIVDCQIDLAHAELNSPDQYQRYFHQQPNFLAQHNQIIFPRHIALAPLITSEPEYHQALYCKLKDKQMQLSDNFLARARKAIKQRLQIGSVSRTRVAAELSLSEKTLERRLNQHNFSYRELIDTIRLELAQKYLSQTEFTIDEIARQLGYCDRTSFSKAYKKWTGLTPAVQRETYQKPPHSG